MTTSIENLHPSSIVNSNYPVKNKLVIDIHFLFIIDFLQNKFNLNRFKVN